MAAMAGAPVTGECEARVNGETADGAAMDATQGGAASDEEASSGEVEGGGTGTAAPCARVRTAGRVNAVREVWCMREEAAYPSAEMAAGTMVGWIEDVLGESGALHGPPIELRAQLRGADRFAAPMPTGLVSVIRSELEGSSAELVPKLQRQAWRVQYSLDECLVVKAFGKCSNFAKEINWLFKVAEGYIKEGLPLTTDIQEFKIGYYALRPHVARDNGAEWAGPVYGANVCMADLAAMVKWADDQHKAKKLLLVPELRVDPESGRVVSTAVTKGAPGYCFKPAEYITGSALVFMESALDISDFEIGDSDGLPGLEILVAALGEDKVVDVDVSNRGMTDKGVVRARIKCAIRHEKSMRSAIKKLVRQTAGAGESMEFETSEGVIAVKFHSSHTVRELEGDAGGGFGSPFKPSPEDKAEARRKEAILQDLQAHQVKSAAALEQVIDQVQKLAVQQQQAQAHSREVHDALAAQHEQAQAHARELHASLAHEQSLALNTVNRLASVFANFMDQEMRAPARLDAPQTVQTPGSVAPACCTSLGTSVQGSLSDCILYAMPVQAGERGGRSTDGERGGRSADGDGARRALVCRRDERCGRGHAWGSEPRSDGPKEAETLIDCFSLRGVLVGVRQVSTGHGQACNGMVCNQRVRDRYGGSGIQHRRESPSRATGFKRGCLFALCLATGTSPTSGTSVNWDDWQAGGSFAEASLTRGPGNYRGELLRVGASYRRGLSLAETTRYSGRSLEDVITPWDAAYGWWTGSTGARAAREDLRVAALEAGTLTSEIVRHKRGYDWVVPDASGWLWLYGVEDAGPCDSRACFRGSHGSIVGVPVGLGCRHRSASLACVAQKEACFLHRGPQELQEKICSASRVEHSETRDLAAWHFVRPGEPVAYGTALQESHCSIMRLTHGWRGEGTCGLHPFSLGGRASVSGCYFGCHSVGCVGLQGGSASVGSRHHAGVGLSALGKRETRFRGRPGTARTGGGAAGTRGRQDSVGTQIVAAAAKEQVEWHWRVGRSAQLQSEHFDGQSSAHGIAAATQCSGQGLCLSAGGAGLGFLNGCSHGWRPGYQDRTSGCVGLGGQGHCRAGSAHGSGDATCDGSRYSDGMAVFLQSSSLRLVVVWHRLHGGCSRQIVRRSLQVRAGCRGQRYGGEGSAGSVGGKAQEEYGQCFGCWHGSGAQGSEEQSRSYDAQLPVCTVVTSERYSSAKRSAHCASRTCAGGEPGVAAAGVLDSTAGDHDRVRRWHAAARLKQAVGHSAGACNGASGVGMVASTDMPKRYFGRLRPQAQSVDCGDTAWVILGGVFLLQAYKHGRPWVVLAKRRSIRPGGSLGCGSWNWMEGLLSLSGQEVGSVGGALHLQVRDSTRNLQSRSTQVGTKGAPQLRLRGGGGPPRALHGCGRGQSDTQRQGSEDSSAQTSQLWQGRCICWNARQLFVPVCARGGGGADILGAAGSKLNFLERQIDWHAPWIVALMEVGGGLDRMRALRLWFRERGLTDMVFLMGEGGSARSNECDSGAGVLTNGIVVACHRDVTILSACKIAFRTFAITALHKSSLTRLSLVILHGASTEGCASDDDLDVASGQASFVDQLDAAAAWCATRDGVILMDANRVPCRSWRSPASAQLSRGDVALRALCGWSCGCCVATADSERCAGATLIGSQLSLQGEPLWTRQGMVEGRVVRSRLDIGLAFGKAESQWTEAQLVDPVLRSSVGDDRVSDHALLVLELRLLGSVARGEDRPLPVRLGPRSGEGGAHGKLSAWKRMADITGAQAFRDELLEGLSQAETTGRSQVSVLVSLLRRAGEEAVRAVQTKGKAGSSTGSPKRAYDDHSEVQSWSRRLRLAQELAHSGGALSEADWKTLFHPRSGMHMWCRSRSAADVGNVPWTEVVLRCRRQLSRARKFSRNRKDGEDAWLASKCQAIEERSGSGELSAHVRTIWRLIGKRCEQTKVHTVHRGDRKEAPQIAVDDPDFLAELGRIGESFVLSLDKGSVPDAFRAWLDVFGSPHEELEGTSGGAWKLEKEFTFELFSRCLRMMQGKAVGAGGLSVELLLAAGKEIQWLFYSALLRDVRVGCLAPHWRKVLYVLLRKPPPNDAAILAQRREIALMPQDMKILLQGIRLAAYEKIGDKLDSAQFGWKKGMGCADPSLALACVLDQTRRLQHKAWLLYIDLANFFPAINRSIACSSELFMGLPDEVADILGQIYGGQRGYTSRVECQYESGAGLGAPFENKMGRLMGCPVSPDSAKILLNSVLLAIRASVKGIKLWPFSGEEVCQLAFADDWVGTFEDVGELRKALEIWLAWAEVVGARLGIKGLVKTVVTGVDFSSSKPRTPPDPGLHDLEGRRIPLLPCDELYKHLGVPRTACADGEKSWSGHKGVQGIRDKLRAGVTRLRQLRPGKTSPEQFICISNVLLGGLGCFYLQSSVASLPELEQIEREWRRCFNRFTRRDYASRALPLYMASANWKKGRIHLARVGTAALFTAVEKAMSDTVDSPARAAVRSAIALSLHQWGCRSAPNEWKWAHLRKPLEKATSRKGARFIGDAWMLSCLQIEEGRCPEKDKKCRDEILRQAAWGRLGDRDHQGGGPLGATGSHWHHSSRLLFEPREQGGLGLDLRPLLMQAGVCEVSQMTTNPFKESTHGGRWLLDKKVVEHRTGRRVSTAMWKQWLDVIRVLQVRKVCPPRQDWAGTSKLRCYPKGDRPVKGKATYMDVASGLRKQRLGLRRSSSVSHYAAILRDAFRPVARPSCGALDGGRHGTPQREMATVGWSLDKDGAEHFERWRGGAEDRPLSLDARWQEAAADLAKTVCFREGDGWPMDGRTGEELRLGDADCWPPAPQLVIRARLILGKDASVVGRSYGEKITSARVAEDVQRENWSRLCELQSRLAFSHAFATDASEGEAPLNEGEPRSDAWGWPRRRTAAAVVAHSGRIEGGCLAENLPSDSYLGELAALVEALKRAPGGSRVLLVLDSTSPVRAWLRFRAKGARAKRQYNAAFGLQLLEEQIRRHELVYFMWQRSHCGSPMNEVADMAADRFRLEGADSIRIEAFSGTVADMWPSRACGHLFAWAVDACKESIHEHIRTGGAHAIDPQEDEWELGVLQGAVGAAAALLREDKLMVADAGHGTGRRERNAATSKCPLGCDVSGGTWHHYLFSCEHPRLLNAKRCWTRWVQFNRRSFDPLCTNNQVSALLSLMPSSSGRPTNRGLRCLKSDVREVRRMLCGFVRRDLDGDGVGSESRIAVRRLVIGGLRILRKAVALETEVRKQVDQSMRENWLLSKVVRAWRMAVLKGNPLRVAALRQLRRVRDAGRLIWQNGRRPNVLACGWGLERFRDVVTSHLVRARAEIDRYFPDLGDEAIVWWFLQMKLRGWWGRRQNGFAKTVPWEAWTVSLEAARDVVRKGARGFGRGAHVSWSWSGVGAEAMAINTPAYALVDGVAGFDQVSVLPLHFEAGRAFFGLGGVKKLKGVLLSIRRAKAETKWDTLRLRIANFRQFGTCSGRDPQPVADEEKITVIIGSRKRTRRVDREWSEGARADKRGRWAVDELTAVRRREGSRGWEVLVLWAGGHDPSWVRLMDLDRGLREEARAMINESLASGSGESASALGKRRRGAQSSAAPQGKATAAAVKRSPRLVEAEEKKRKLLTAIVPFTGQAANVLSKKKRSCYLHRVRKVWGLHVRDSVEVVHVVWEEEVDNDLSVIPVGWLTEDLQLEVRREAERDRAAEGSPGPSGVHPFFSNWGRALNSAPCLSPSAP